MLMLHPHLHRHLHSLYLAAIFPKSPTHPLHYTVALKSGSEARYVRLQGCGLGIQPLYLPLQASCMLLSSLRRHACCSHRCDGIPVALVVAMACLLLSLLRRLAYSSRRCDSMPSLGPSLNDGEIVLAHRLRLISVSPYRPVYALSHTASGYSCL